VLWLASRYRVENEQVFDDDWQRKNENGKPKTATTGVSTFSIADKLLAAKLAVLAELRALLNAEAALLASVLTKSDITSAFQHLSCV